MEGRVPSYSDRTVAEEDALLVPGVLRVENNLRVQYPEELTLPTDKDIKDALMNILAMDARIDSSSVNVAVSNGVVTLEGSVGAYWKKLIVEDQAYSLMGVIDVINKLTVVPTKDFVDEKIADNIRKALDRSILSDADRVSVKVVNGEVTLKGQVSSFTAKRNIQNIAYYTPGVIQVHDELMIE